MNAPVTVRSTAPPAGSASLETGLVATARAGAWEISVDEELGAAGRWFVQIEGPAVYLYARIDGPTTLDCWHAFLERNLSRTIDPPPSSNFAESSEFQLSNDGESVVRFLWDEEYATRCFLVVCAQGCLCMRLELMGQDLSSLGEAVKEVRNELVHSGMLLAPNG